MLACRVLVSASRRNNLSFVFRPKLTEQSRKKVRDREDALAYHAGRVRSPDWIIRRLRFWRGCVVYRRRVPVRRLDDMREAEVGRHSE